MNDAAPPHKALYRWEKRQSALDQPSKPTKHDDIKTWLRQVENASSNAVETVFPRSSGRQTGKTLVNQAAVYAKTTDTTYTEARAILDEWMNDKLRLEAGLNDSYDEEIVQSNVRSVKQACNLSFHDDDDDDNQLEFLREPKDLLIFQDPSVYYETHDETDLVKDILHDLRSKDILTRQQLIAMEKNKSSTVDIQTKIEERHRQVKENHERIQKERELKRKQIQAKKEAEAQARLLVLKEERERALKAKQEEEMIERHVIEIRKEMHEKRLQDEEQRKHQREYGNAKLERTKAEQDRARKEEELHKLKEIALKEQQDLNEKRLQTLVDDFIRMKSLTIIQKHFSAWLNVVLERRLQMGRAAALADWKLLFQSFNWWRSIIRTKKLEEETEAHMTEMKIFTMKMQQASLHYERTLLRKSMIIWQIYIRNERIAKNLKYEQETTKKKIDAFLEAASTGKLWENEQQTPTTTTTNATAITTRQQSQQIKPRKVSITTRPSSLTSRSRSAITFGDKSSLLTRTQSDIKLDDFFQTTSPHNEQEESQRAVSAGLPLATDTRRMHLDFDELSSSDEDLSKKKIREKRIRLEMAEHKSTSRVMNTFEHRYNAQMKMLKEQNHLLKNQQRMIEELKYQQDHQAMHNQIANLEALKAQQNEMEEKQRKQLVTDRRHATALIQAHNRGELQKQFNTSRLDQTLTDRPTTRNDMLLVNMEERARRRYVLKTEREAKRRAIEEEKFAKVQQLMEEKIHQEEEEKRLKVEEAREKRRLEKERELDRKHFEERLRLLNEKADIHCRLYQMRYYGLNPLKKLILIRHQQIQTAEEHYNYIIVQRTFNVWYETIRRDIEIKTNRALEFHKHLLYRRYFTSWQRYKHQAEIAEERAERHYTKHLMINTFKIWQDYTQTEIIRLWRLDDLAKEHNVKRILKNIFIIWRQYPMERRKERGREKRLAEMRLKVKDLLPDFRGTESSSSSLNAINGSDNKT